MAGKNEAKITFNAETEQFRQSVNEATSEMYTLRAEMRLNEAQFKNTGDQTEYLQNKTELLEAQLEANADKQEALTQMLEVARSTYGDNSEEVAKLERQLINAQTEEEKLKTQLDTANQGLTDQSQASEEAGASVGDMAEALAGAGIAATVKEIADAAFDLAGNFSEASAAIVEGAGLVGDELADLNQQARDAFGQIADSDADLTTVASTMAEISTRFHLTGDEAEGMAVKISNFAQHTGTDGVNAVDDLANIMQRWNLDMSDADGLMDDLVTASQSCQMSESELARALAENSVQFQELGYSTEDALALLVSLSDGGANTSSVMAGMKKAVGNLSGATDDVPGSFQEAIKAISECDSVSEALQAQVGDTGLTVEQVFGSKAAQELATNIQNGNFNIEEWTSVLQNNQGALDQTTENATTMGDSMAQASNNIALAMAPVTDIIATVAQKFAEVTSTVAQFVQQSPAAQAIVVALATVFGILAAALAIGGIITAITTALGALAGVVAVITSPIFLIVAALAALAAGFAYAYTHCETFRNIVNTVIAAVKTFVLNTIKGIVSGMSAAWNGIKSTAVAMWNGIKTSIIDPVKNAATTVATTVTSIKTKFTSIVNGIKSAVTSSFNAIKTAMTKPIETARTTIKNIMDKIKGFFPLKIGKIFSGLKIPSISVSAGKAPFGIGGKGSLPKFHVNWHAKGVVFDTPTIFPSLRGYEGVGEAGPEAVSPVSVLQEYIGAAVQKYMPMPIDYDLLGFKVAKAVAALDITMEVDDRELGRVVRRLA